LSYPFALQNAPNTQILMTHFTNCLWQCRISHCPIPYITEDGLRAF